LRGENLLSQSPLELPLHPGDSVRIPAANDTDGRNPGQNCCR